MLQVRIMAVRGYTGEAMTLTGTLAAAIEGVAYSSGLTAVDSVGAVAWTISVGTLPAGLTINASTGLVTGTPTAAGTSNITIRAEDSIGQVATSAQVLEVEPAWCDANFSALVAGLHFDGAHGSATFTDIKGGTYTRNSSAVDCIISTAQSVFGGASLRVGVNSGGASNSISRNSADFGFGTGDFCVATWVRVDALTGNRYLWDFGNNWGMCTIDGGRLRYYNATIGVGSALYATGGGLVSANTWYRVRVSRIGGTTRFFVGLPGGSESLMSSAADAHNFGATASVLTIGHYGGVVGGYNLGGFLDDFQVYKGNGISATALTVPTQAFADAACP